MDHMMKSNILIKGIHKRWSVLAMGMICSALAVQHAVAAPLMIFTDYVEQVGELDHLTAPASNTVSALERKHSYKVTNVSAQYIPENYLLELILPAGSSQGVYYAEESTKSWSVQIFANHTVFSGNGDFIGPAENKTFSLFVPDIQPIGTGLAEAVSGTLDFNTVSIACPIDFPPTTIPLSIMGNSFGFDAAPGKTYHVYFTTSLADGSWSTRMIISGNGANITIPFDLYHDAGFYKVEEL